MHAACTPHARRMHAACTLHEQVQLQLHEFLSLLTRLCFLKANPRYGKKDPKGRGARRKHSTAHAPRPPCPDAPPLPHDTRRW